MEIIQPKILPVVGYGSPILREKSVEAENKPETQILIQDMFRTMNSIGTAVGLAGNQVNSNLSLFVMKHTGVDMVVINPVIRKRRGTEIYEEGCLSIPEIHGKGPLRSSIIDVEFFDEKFNRRQMKLRGFSSIVFQHEYDHLIGTFFIDHLTKEGREEIAYKLSEIEKGSVKTSYDMIFPK